jgi:hypothetical protein
MIEIAVADIGPGIPADIAGRLLSHSFQASTMAWDLGCRFRARSSKRTMVN